MNKEIPAGMITLYSHKGKIFNETSVISEKFIEYDWSDLDYLVWSGIVKKSVLRCGVNASYENGIFNATNVEPYGNSISSDAKFDPEEFMKIAGGIEVYHIDHKFSDNQVEFRYNQDIKPSIPRFIFLGSV